jgi:CBS domain-containing protein
MITEDTINFLKSIPPFQFLHDKAVRSIAGNLSMEFFPGNSQILTQGGPPSDSLRIIKKGGVKIFFSNEDEIIIDYRGEGECFGYISLISGDRSRTNVQAIEDTICYGIPKNIILQIINTEPLFGEYFMKSFFKNYIDKTYQEMRNKNLLFKEGEKLLYTTPVKDIVSKTAVTSTEDITIKEAAGIMTRNMISSLIFTNKAGSPVGIITDRDLRGKVVANGIDPLEPVKTIMSTGLVAVDFRSTCFDALSTMIQHNIHHLIVTEGSELRGVVTNHDFMLLQGTSPLSILKNIDGLQSVDELQFVRDKISQTISILLKEGVKATYILRIITELHDRLIHKIIDLSIEKIGESLCPFAFFVYGSEGRREETFKTVFRCAIVYNEAKSFSEKKDMEEFCEKLIGYLQDIFKKCGLPLFDTQPLDAAVSICGDIADWERNILFALRSGEPAYVTMAKKMLDLRAIYGDEEIVEDLRERLYSQIRKSSKYNSMLIGTVLRERSPVGFFKRFAVDETGEQMEHLDIKEKGAYHIVDSIRALAIVHNVHETSTVERLNLLTRSGTVRNELRNEIYPAFEFLLHLLMESQLIKRDSNMEIDNIIETEKLSMLEKKSLKEVFHIIKILQDFVKKSFDHQKKMAK